MGQGQGSISVNQRILPSGPPFVATSAENGLSVDSITGRILLGQTFGQVGNPGQLLHNTEIPLNGFAFDIGTGATRMLIDEVLPQIAFSCDNFGVSNLGSAMLNLNQSLGLYEIGDIGFNIFTGLKLSLDSANSVASLNDRNGEYINLSASNVILTLGDITPVGFGTRLIISDVQQQINIQDTNGSYFHVDIRNDVYSMGDLSGLTNGYFLQINDFASTVQIANSVEIMLALTQQVYTLGNVNDTLLGSKISIDDLNETLVFQSLANGRMLSLSGFNQQYQFGDIDNTHNGCIIKIDDLFRTFYISDAVGNYFNIDIVNLLSNWTFTNVGIQ